MANPQWPLSLPQRAGVDGFAEWQRPRTITT